jgi:23S rRNA (guanosine2251-2'-O)-methyltransferase
MAKPPFKKHSGPPQTTFRINEWEVAKEYIRNSPQIVVKIESKPHFKDKILAAYREEGHSPPQIEIADLQEGDFNVWVKLNLMSEDSFLARIESVKPQIVAVLDHVKDPHNLGAIVRSAAFFGITEILVPKDRQVLITPATVNVSRGGFSVVHLTAVTNLTRTVEKLKKMSYWVVGADIRGQELSKIPEGLEYLVIVMGSEDKGIGKNLGDQCDFLFSLYPGQGVIDSLNVSVAAGISFHYFRTKYFVG